LLQVEIEIPNLRFLPFDLKLVETLETHSLARTELSSIYYNSGHGERIYRIGSGDSNNSFSIRHGNMFTFSGNSETALHKSFDGSLMVYSR
jgi:hypothetical protein